MSTLRRSAARAVTLLLTGMLALPVLPATAALAATTNLTEADSGTTVTVQVGQAVITVTVADNHATVGLRVGDTLVVSLPGNYRPTTVSSAVLAAQATTGGFPTGQPLLVRYAAVRPGQADVATLTDATCLHTVPRCALPQLRWTVRVEVTR